MEACEVENRSSHVFSSWLVRGHLRMRSEFKQNEPRRQNTPPKKRKKASWLVHSGLLHSGWLTASFSVAAQNQIVEMWCLSTDTRFRAAEVMRNVQWRMARCNQRTATASDVIAHGEMETQFQPFECKRCDVMGTQQNTKNGEAAVKMSPTVRVIMNA